MNNFKSGSGDLDFGSSDDADEQTETPAEPSQTQNEGNQSDGSESSNETSAASLDQSSPDTGSTSTQSPSDRVSTSESSRSDPVEKQYPYFVRRSNVGDERDTRLEIHVRDKVANQEAKFRNELAEYLGVSEVSKTDAREFALLAAFQDPKQVAELMQDEGFGTLS